MANLPLRSFPQNFINTVSTAKTAPRYMSKRPILSITIPGPDAVLSRTENEVSCFSPDSPDSPDPEVMIDSTSDEESESEEAEAQTWISSPASESKRASCCLVTQETGTSVQTQCWPTRATTC
ncbi:uncharacterized protein MELLADRAFT_72655 [Melampsora larici-populina 98AG31]|uniref:Uncharacterized protein n=1 Tax=Melampsora larici-populina (strain 98AG31 / pathotype 3-4-7) TaxID=747676 RepID=F4RX60_MELLP|nr:uncharacterized protein MELLADRAFT_72655 [Melampsora larici-populina 98AG31]EGG02908.1 hypothetical protein MELLADRAFT_72655 [Melampsora larici-populina 98AG31]